MLWWHVVPRASPSLGLPGLVGLLLHWGPLLRCCLMYPHGLRSTWRSRACGDNAGALLVDFSFHNNMSHRSTPDLAESLRTTPYERLTEGSRHNPFPERVHHHVLILGVEPHHLCPKTIEEILQGLSLILSYVEKIIRDWRGSPTGYVLLPEQCRKLRERRHMPIREADKPIQHCACQCTHEHLATHCIGASS